MSQARAASEPLLWLQLLGAALLPLEALLVLLLLAGSDPGPLPSLERLLCWSIGGLAPALLLWRKPADVWSLLLVQTPARGRRDLQRRLSALQETLPLKVALAIGSALLLVLLWRLDGAAALASALAPLPDAPRLVDLLLSAPLLALMLWQWQQLLQSLWLLSRSPATIAAAAPLDAAALAERRLSLGLPLLLPQPLALSGARAPEAAPTESPDPATAAADAEQEVEAQTASDLEPELEPEAEAEPKPEPEPLPEPESEPEVPGEPAPEPAQVTDGTIDAIEVQAEPLEADETSGSFDRAPAKPRDGAVEIVDVEPEDGDQDPPDA
ncbi:MAG: low-complexity tail membrane protein [Cyanobium sp.]